ncbi:hypothetical protein E4U53_005056, partial [Claviceps sorghi]
PRRADESSDESSSDSDVSTDDEDQRKKAPACGHGRGHEHGRKPAPLGDKKGGKNMKMKRERAPSPNAYEKVPRKKG